MTLLLQGLGDGAQAVARRTKLLHTLDHGLLGRVGHQVSRFGRISEGHLPADEPTLGPLRLFALSDTRVTAQVTDFRLSHPPKRGVGPMNRSIRHGTTKRH